MKTSLLFLLALAGLVQAADDTALLAIPGKVIYENKLDGTPGAPWRFAKGRWEMVDGVLRGAELAADKSLGAQVLEALACDQIGGGRRVRE